MTRKQLSCALTLNALTKPANVTVPAAVIVAALLFGAPWLLFVALAAWCGLVVATFFDEREAERVGRSRRPEVTPPRLSDPSVYARDIAKRVRAARAARAAIRLAVLESGLALPDVTEEVDALVVAVHGVADRAQRIQDFLADEPDADAASLARLNHLLEELYTEMDEIVAALQTVHAELLATFSS
jgi:hypothetical protein